MQSSTAAKPQGAEYRSACGCWTMSRKGRLSHPLTRENIRERFCQAHLVEIIKLNPEKFA